MSEHNISYEAIDDALLKLDAINEASEAHGALCGMTCISGTGDINNWLTHILGKVDANNIELGDSESILQTLHDKTVAVLTQQNYELELLIHSDDDPLDVRIDDLCNWCQGFLYGLSVAGLTDISKLPSEASEILQDMMDISKAGYDSEDDEEENEAAFSEIVEYLRIGVYLIYSTFNGNGLTSDAPVLH